MPNRRRTRRASKTERQIRQLQHDLHGIKLHPPIDPPPFVVNPWNNLTCNLLTQVSNTTPIQIKNSDVFGAICRGIGVAVNASIEMRLRSISCWLLGNAWKQMFFSVRSYDGNTLYTGVDESTTANAPKFGYAFPSTYSERNIGRSNDADIILVIQAARAVNTAATNTAWFDTRFRVLWRYNTDTPLSRLNNLSLSSQSGSSSSHQRDLSSPFEIVP